MEAYIIRTGLTVDEDAPTRIVLLPSFVETGMIALVCLETLECKTVGFEIPTWAGDASNVKEEGQDDDMD